MGSGEAFATRYEGSAIRVDVVFEGVRRRWSAEKSGPACRAVRRPAGEGTGRSVLRGPRGVGTRVPGPPPSGGGRNRPQCAEVAAETSCPPSRDPATKVIGRSGGR